MCKSERIVVRLFDIGNDTDVPGSHKYHCLRSVSISNEIDCAYRWCTRAYLGMRAGFIDVKGSVLNFTRLCLEFNEVFLRDARRQKFDVTCIIAYIQRRTRE